MQTVYARFILRLMLSFLSVILIAAPSDAVDQNKWFKHGLRHRQKIDDKIFDMGRTIGREQSDWISSEKELYKGILAKKKYDILLVPFQTMQQPIALTSRKLMTYKLASEIENRTELSVAPIHLVYRSLGNTARYYQEAEVYDLAETLGVRQIIWGFSGHFLNQNKQTDLTFSVIEQKRVKHPIGLDPDCRRWNGTHSGSDIFPYEAFDSKMPSVLEFLGYSKQSKKSIKKEYPYLKFLKLPDSPMQMVRSEEKSHLVQAYYFQLLGLLTPSLCSIETQREFFLRSLVQLWQVEKSSPDLNLILARAFLYLGRRPIAIRILSSVDSPEERSFKEYLNANFNDQSDHVENISSKLKKLMANIERHRLKVKYDSIERKPDIKDYLDGLPEKWQFLVAQKMLEQYDWSVQSNVYVKALLDEEFPVDGLTMESLLRSAIASGDLEQKKLGFELLFVDHLSKAIQSPKTKLFSENESYGLSEYDYLLLIQAIGEANLLKSIRFFKKVQGKYEIALGLINEYIKVFQGHPAFHISKSLVLDRIYGNAKSLAERKRKDIEKRILTNGYYGLWWVGQNDWAIKTKDAVEVLEYFGRQKESKQLTSAINKYEGEKFVNHLRNEFPPGLDNLLESSFYTNFEKTSHIHDDIDQFYLIIEKMIRYHDDAMKVLIENEDRFKGNPFRASKSAGISILLGNQEAIENIYLTGIKENPQFWENYMNLGKRYIEKGEYQKAKALFIGFPPFVDENAGYNRVGLSNISYEAGNALYSRGAYDEARPLLKISADLKTGSFASLASQEKIFILDKDFDSAPAYSLKRAKRYNSRDAYKEYMCLLHVLGQSELAWPIFDTLIGRYSTPEIWTSALVGHRVNAADDLELSQWLSKKLKLIKKENCFPARFILLTMVDRKPEFEKTKMLEMLGEMNASFTPSRDTSETEKLISGKIDYKHGVLLKQDEMNKIGKKVKRPINKYKTVAEMYNQIKQKQYSKALDALKRLALVTNYLSPGGRQLLPYLVFSACKTGETVIFDKLLNSIFYEINDYDVTLAWAVFHGLNGRTDEALKSMRVAFNHQPQMENRLFLAWYQIVEILEWLYEESGDFRYIDQALKWAIDYQEIQPMFAWAYAFEAKYTRDPERRLRALSYASYLDRKSAWISQFSDDEMKKATVWLKRNNMFEIMDTKFSHKKSSI